jgi:sucrose phosphorylase
MNSKAVLETHHMSDIQYVLHDSLAFLYGQEQASDLAQRLLTVLEQFRQNHPEVSKSSESVRVSERDAILISYGDMVQEPGQSHLKTLGNFLKQYLKDTISSVHLLPFFPYSSDDGFSVIDYLQVNTDLGSWEDISRIGENFRLMFDAVINHVSAKSEWFQRFLLDDPTYDDYFIVTEPDTDLSMVFRPRSSPLLTPFQTPSGEKLVWTTFSADQIDLNYQNPEVLFEIIKILLYYVAKGAEFLRLDAVTFLWKEISTSSANLLQTHSVIQLIRTVLDVVAPCVTIITETNIPHKDNIAYFGDGTNEAQMVYNFALPMLTIHAFNSGSADTLSNWATTLDLPSDQTTFFNFLAGHDGIGIQPVRNILSQKDIYQLIDHAVDQGGYISHKSDSDGSLSPYEININYLDILSDSAKQNENLNLVTQRFITSHAIMFALRGVPGIYFHSLFGSRNWNAGVDQTGRYRTINREKLRRADLEADLANEASLRNQVFHPLSRLLRKRGASNAFHPAGGQRVIRCHEGIFALVRSSIDSRNRVLCLHNVSSEKLDISVDLRAASIAPANNLVDLLSGETSVFEGNRIELSLEPYQFRWLQAE